MRNQNDTFLLVIQDGLADLLPVPQPLVRSLTRATAQANLVPRPEILRRPEQIPLHKALEKIKPEAKGTVVQTGDGTVKGVLKPGLNEA